jgi:hypothetical protein
MNEAFFRRCWLTLAATNPRLRKRMLEIECAVEGIRIREQKPLPDESKARQNDESEEIVPI